MPPLARTLGLALLLVAAPLSAQTAGPYGGPPPQTWPERPNYQAPAPRQPAAGQVLRAAYEAEVPGSHPANLEGGPQGLGGSGSAGSLALPAPTNTLPLPPQGAAGSRQRSGGGLPSGVTVVGSLAVVLGLFFLLAWALRRAAPAESAVLPGEVVEVLGRKVVGQRQQLQLLRCGSKLLLVSVTPDGAETLTEITEPQEVDRLAGLCRQTQPGSATATFRQMFQQFSTEPREGRDV